MLVGSSVVEKSSLIEFALSATIVLKLQVICNGGLLGVILVVAVAVLLEE